MLKILQREPQSIWEKNRFRETSLHLACDWFEGLNILLDHGAKAIVNEQSAVNYASALDYAIAAESLDTTRLLLQNDSRLTNLGLRLSVMTRREDIIELCISFLRDRRIQLRRTVLHFLPKRVIESLSVAADSLPDSNAHLLQNALRLYNIDWPYHLAVSMRAETVYHCGMDDLRSADALWNAGFRDIEGRDAWGLTPLMAYRAHQNFGEEIVYITWLLAKGASLETVSPLCSAAPHYQTSHIVARNLACSFCVSNDRFSYSYAFPEEKSSLFRQILAGIPANQLATAVHIFNTQTPDSCCCGCSTGGCLPLKILLGRTFKSWRRNYGLSLVRWLELDQNGIESISSRVWREIIRFLTFELLGLRHTCCRSSYWDATILEACEVKEIRDEQKWLLVQLEELVKEFEDAYLIQHTSISAFLSTVWKRRMTQVFMDLLSREDDERSRLANLGVKIMDENMGVTGMPNKDERLLWLQVFFGCPEDLAMDHCWLEPTNQVSSI